MSKLQLQFVDEMSRLDQAFRRGLVRETISELRREVSDALGGSSGEEVAEPEDRGASERPGGGQGGTEVDATPGA